MLTRQSTDRAGTHIGVVSVHASDKISEAILLLVFVWDENCISIEGALVYLEPCLVCNPVAVSESRSGRMMISGHIMDGSTRKKDEVQRNNLVA